ncbi:MAG: hypothetical protein JXR96_16315 [Deltaproteobacteria bacterium]|nr:hypothetical protein [Deltaproteobacteria bacterium]
MSGCLRPGLFSLTGALLACTLLACETEVTRVPGTECLLNLRIHTPPYQDAFDGVSSLRLVLENAGGVVEESVDGSASEFVIDASPAEDVVLTLEGLDIDGQVLSRGTSAVFDLHPEKAADVDLLFARTGEFALLMGGLGYARFGHTATALPDGRVLVFGGASAGDVDDPDGLAPPEIYDPKTQISCVEAGTDCPHFLGADLRFGHTAVGTDGGKVIVIGGEDDAGLLVDVILALDDDGLRKVEGYDPESVPPRAYHAVARFYRNEAQQWHETILIAGGQVADGAGGQISDGAVLMDARSETFIQTGLRMVRARAAHSATVFGPDRDRVLIAGGKGPGGLLAPVEIFDGQQFSVVEPQGSGALAALSTPRLHHAACEFGGGVILIGGDDGLLTVDAPEIFFMEAALGTGVFALDIRASHAEHCTRRGAAVIVLPSGGLMLAGGEYMDGFDRRLLSSAEIMQRETGSLDVAFFGIAPLGTELAHPTVAVLPGGGVLMTGGLEHGPSGLVASDDVWYYNPR